MILDARLILTYAWLLQLGVSTFRVTSPPAPEDGIFTRQDVLLLLGDVLTPSLKGTIPSGVFQIED